MYLFSLKQYTPALPETLYECLVERCILGNGLHNGAITGHMPNRPLTHLCATETKDVAVDAQREPLRD